MKLLVINGPNLNMLGIREPDVYGKKTYGQLLEEIQGWANSFGVEIDVFQSNHEGAIVDKIQEAYGVYDGLVINPAAFTHTSIAILDAIKAIGILAVEVHLSDIESREEYRKHSYIKEACIGQVCGKGFDGYREAIEMIVEELNMDQELLIRKNVIKAGLELVKGGLITRTWGNVSQRVDGSHYYITPSGKAYDQITEDHIVKMDIASGSYEGDVKPSSEYRIHSEIYKQRPDVNFIIHTHQDMASAISVLNLREIRINCKMNAIGKTVPFARYGLPGSEKLAANVAKALKLSKGNTIILRNHGTLCFGATYEEAFEAASRLEKISKDILVSRGIDYVIDHKLPRERVLVEADGVSIYNDTDIAMKVCQLEKVLKPYIDDFAQIVGCQVDLDRNKGVYCKAKDEEELEAVYSIVSKNCLAYLASRTGKGAKPIRKAECKRMRENYLNNYSKLKDK